MFKNLENENDIIKYSITDFFYQNSVSKNYNFSKGDGLKNHYMKLDKTDFDHYPILDFISDFSIYELAILTENNDFTNFSNYDESLEIYALAGNDKVFGTNYNDIFHGGSGSDTLLGGDGDDYFYENLNNETEKDIIYGGQGNDTIDYSASGDGIKVDLEYSNYVTSTNLTNSSHDEIYSIENIIGTSFNDRIKGDSSNNIIKGNSGNDTLEGNNGDDILISGIGNNTLSGGSGSDILIGEGGDNVLLGGSGNDHIIVNGGNNLIRGGNGKDVIDYSYSSTGISANLGSRSINYDAGFLEGYVISHSDGNELFFDIFNSQFGYDYVADDIILGTQYSDNIILGVDALGVDTGDGNDYVSGADSFLFFGMQYTNEQILREGTYEIYLGNGNDIFEIGNSSETAQMYSYKIYEVHGGDGNDTIEVRTGEAEIYGGNGDDYLSAGNYDNNDTSAATAIINGGDGNDYIEGSFGSDEIYGGNGNDIIIGGSGEDLLNGGLGKDIFIFNQKTNSNILDFQENVDKIDLSILDTSFQELSLVQNFSGTMISIEDIFISLNNVSINSLDEADFIF